jgi:hypothetical protein
MLSTCLKLEEAVHLNGSGELVYKCNNFLGLEYINVNLLPSEYHRPSVIFKCFCSLQECILLQDIKIDPLDFLMHQMCKLKCGHYAYIKCLQSMATSLRVAAIASLFDRTCGYCERIDIQLQDTPPISKEVFMARCERCINVCSFPGVSEGEKTRELPCGHIIHCNECDLVSAGLDKNAPSFSFEAAIIECPQCYRIALSTSKAIVKGALLIVNGEEKQKKEKNQQEKIKDEHSKFASIGNSDIITNVRQQFMENSDSIYGNARARYNHLKSKSNELMVENAKLRAVSLPGIVCAGTWQKKEEKRKAKVKDQATNSKEGETVVQVD